MLPNGVFEQVGATVEDTEGLVDYARSIDGVEVGALIEERSGVIKASLRAKNASYRVDTIASQFNGGGHRLASGCVLETTLDDARQRILAAVSAALDT